MQGDAAHVKIKAPSNLFRPYLPYRLNDEYNHMALCRACLTHKFAKKCVHRVTENRCFVSCYQVTDLEKAVSLGYEILEWYELHHYSERKPIFETFVQILASQKLKSTNLFSNTPPEEAQKICDDINATMKLKGNLAINASQIVPNSAQKQLYKEMLNSFYGRFALHTNFTKHYFCRNIYEIEKYASVPDNHVLDIIPLTDEFLEIIGLYIAEGYSRSVNSKKGLNQVYISSMNQELRNFIKKTMLLGNAFKLKAFSAF
jgi:hypothetical protein